MKPLRTRFQLFLPDDLAREVEALAREPGTSKSDILEHAVRGWLRQRASDAFDDRFAIRLDRICRRQHEVERKIDHLSLTVQATVVNFLTLIADHLPFDADRKAVGTRIYAEFMRSVEARLKDEGDRRPGNDIDATAD